MIRSSGRSATAVARSRRPRITLSVRRRRPLMLGRVVSPTTPPLQKPRRA